MAMPGCSALSALGNQPLQMTGDTRVKPGGLLWRGQGPCRSSLLKRQMPSGATAWTYTGSPHQGLQLHRHGFTGALQPSDAMSGELLTGVQQPFKILAILALWIFQIFSQMFHQLQTYCLSEAGRQRDHPARQDRCSCSFSTKVQFRC